MGEREKTIYKVTLIGSVVNFLLLVFKFVAGVLGHSSAMIADAVHSLSDFVSDVVVLVFVKISGKPEDTDHGYGHGKYETLASVIIGIMLAGVGVGLLYNGVAECVAILRGADVESPNMWALSAAIISILLKEGLYRYTVIFSRRLKSSALKANALHHRSDAFTSIATLAGIFGAMLLGRKWVMLDPLAAAVVSVFIMVMGWKLTKNGIDELLEKSLPESVRQKIVEVIMSTPGVISIGHLRTRRIGPLDAIDAHVKMDGEMTLKESHDVATEVERRLRKSLGQETHVSIHMEPYHIADKASR